MDVSTLTPRTFAYALGTSYGHIKRFYYDKPISSQYETFEISKKLGGKRKISAPSPKLKHLQLKILNLLEPLYPSRSQVHGFVKGRSIVTNAELHTRRKFVFNIDLENFFSTITFPRVRGVLMSKPYGFQPETASVIAHLCCVNGALPQGAPTSPLISNIICAKLDAELTAFARQNNFTYSRYADDITFSFNGALDRALGTLIEGEDEKVLWLGHQAVVANPLLLLINNNGFAINNKKVRLQKNSRRQVVTGLIVNKKVNVDRKFVRKTSAMIYSIEEGGVKGAQAKFTADNPDGGSVVKSTHGRLLFIKQVKGGDSPVYQKLAYRFNDLHLSVRVPISVKNTRKEDVQKRRHFASACWCIEVKVGEDFSEGSGFMLENDILVTNAHVIPNPMPSNAEIYVGKPRDRYIEADLVRICRHQDIAILKIRSGNNWPFFDLLPDTENVCKFDEIILAGFPSASRSNTGFAPDVSISWGSVILVRGTSGVEYADIDTNIVAGSSGGVVANKALEVLGISSRGIADDGSGTNTFVSVSTLKRFLLVP